MLSTLAAHYIYEGVKVASYDRRKSNEMLEEATEFINESEKYSHASLETGLRKGIQLFRLNFFLLFFRTSPFG